MASPEPPEAAPSPPPAPNFPKARWRWIALTLLATGAVVAGVFWWSARPDTARNDALLAATDGKFSEAEPQLKAALERKPDDVEVATALAKGYLKQEKPAEAEAALNRWVELRPDDREARRLRFEFYRKAKDLAKAYPDGRRLFELDPSNNQLPRVLMIQSFSLGRFEEAEEYCRKALGELPGDRILRSMLSQIRRARGDFAEAGAILDLLIQDSPSHAPTLMARAIIHLDSGQPDKAVPLLRDVIRIDSKNYERSGRYQLAVALERSGEIDEAKRVTAEVRRLQAVATAEEAIKNQPENLELRTSQGEMLLAAGHVPDGLRFLDAVLARNPEFPPAHSVLAAYYEKVGPPEKAAEHRRKAGK